MIFFFFFFDAKEVWIGSLPFTMRDGKTSRSHAKTDFNAARETAVHPFQPPDMEGFALCLLMLKTFSKYLVNFFLNRQSMQQDEI